MVPIFDFNIRPVSLGLNIDRYISPRRPLTEIEVQNFNYKNRYVHRTHSSKKRKSPETPALSACVFRKKLLETEVPVIFEFVSRISLIDYLVYKAKKWYLSVF